MDALDRLIDDALPPVHENAAKDAIARNLCPHCKRLPFNDPEFRDWMLEGIRQRDRSRLHQTEDQVRRMGRFHRHNVALWLHNTLERMPKAAVTYDDDFRAVAELLHALWSDLVDQSSDPEDPFGLFPDPAIVDP